MIGTEGAVKKGARAPPQLIQVPHLPTGPVLVKRSLLHHHPSRPLLKKNKKDLDETRSKPWRTPHPDQDRPRSAPTTTTVSRPLVSQPAMCLCVCLSVCVCAGQIAAASQPACLGTALCETAAAATTWDDLVNIATRWSRLAPPLSPRPPRVQFTTTQR